jgi:hypothetical protein
MAKPTAVKAQVQAQLRRKRPRPLAIEGPSGARKTRLLRELAEAAPVWWCTARGLADEAVEAMRADRYVAFEKAVATDARPLVIEHIEDLRTKPRTRMELRRVLLARGRGRPSDDPHAHARPRAIGDRALAWSLG